jgi:hypothetical protein
MMNHIKKLFAKSKKGNSGRKPAILGLQSLESREVPSAASSFYMPFFSHASASGGLVRGYGSAGEQSQTTLTASLTGASGTSGTVTLTINSSTGTNSLTVAVSGLTADTTYTVASGTTTLGTITTDSNGNGSLVASNVSVSLASGSAITVEDANGDTVLSGTLASASGTGNGPGMCGGNGQDLTASLTGASGTSGTASVQINTDSGTNKVTVSVSGLTASTTYTVTSGSTTLGTISTNSSGAGELSVRNTAATLTVGSTITVVDSINITVLTGTLAYPVNAITRLTGTLNGSTGTSGTVNYTANSETDTNSISVQVSGLTADTTYTVVSGTTTLGTITTNDNGWGRLIESNVASLSSGSSITVEDASSTTVLSGTLAAATFASPSYSGRYDGFFHHRH